MVSQRPVHGIANDHADCISAARSCEVREAHGHQFLSNGGLPGDGEIALEDVPHRTEDHRQERDIHKPDIPIVRSQDFASVAVALMGSEQKQCEIVR